MADEKTPSVVVDTWLASDMPEARRKALAEFVRKTEWGPVFFTAPIDLPAPPANKDEPKQP